MQQKIDDLLVPNLRFPEFWDAGEWEAKTIGQISKNVIAGGTPSTLETEYWNGNIRWMNSGELNYKKVYEVQGRITEEGLQNSSTKLIPKHCVLIGLAGQGKTRGTVAMNMVELCTNQSIAAIFPSEKIFDSNFLYHNLDSRYDELRRLSTGSEGRGGLNLQIIKSLKINTPSLPEQQKIADCLSSISDRITAETQKLDTLKTHKKGLMQQLFPAEGETLPKLRFPEFHDAEEWKEGELGKYFTRIRNGFVGTATPYYVSNGVPYLQGKNIKQAQIDEKGLVTISNDFHNKQKKSQLQINDILMVQSGHVGECALVNQKFAGSNCHALVVLSPDENTNSAFFVHYFYSPPGKEGIRQITTGNTIEHILTSDLKPLKMYVPSLKEQQKIADCLSSLDDRITAQIQKIDTLKTHKKGLMQQLFPSVEEVKA